MRTLLAVSVVLAISTAVSSQTPAVVESRLLSRFSNIEKWSNYGENSDQDKLDAANKLFKQDLLKYTRLPAVLTYPFPRLKKQIEIVTSKDGRLRIYSWDMQTGGTMHDYDSVYQYRGDSGKVYSIDGSGAGFYHDVFQLSTSSGSVYLPVSTFVASGSLNSSSIEVVRIRSDRLVTGAKLIRTSSGLTGSIDFEYDYSSVMDRDERPIKLFKFDETRRSFSFPVVIVDDDTPQGRVTDKLITYRFDGTNFVKVD